MAHWNHRVVRRTYPDGSVLLGIHEAFCDSEGRVWGITEDPIAPLVEAPEETVDDLKKVIGWMLNACDAPVLDYDKISEEGADSPSWTEDDLEEMDLDD